MSTDWTHDPETGEILATPETAKPNIGEYSVTEISHKLKRTLEDQFGHVRVRGEISGYRGPHYTGHAYFSIKDAGAKIDAVVWRGVFSRLRTILQEGLEVIATGKISSYPGKSSYQIVIENIEAAGVGALMALLEERRRKLAAEGLFDATRKQPIPFLPRSIGVITSPTGAVIRDILHRLAERFPRPVLVWPVRVQGETSAAEVAAAIAGFNALLSPPDLLIVARGGGSLEDLWGFNDEAVVRAVAASKIPVISAVGHETDTTLIDLVADHRAPTPTAAAERAVPVRADLLAELASLQARRSRGLARYYDERRTRLKAAARALPQVDDLLALVRQRLDTAAKALPQSLRSNLQQHRLALTKASSRLSPNQLAQAQQMRQARITTLHDRANRAITSHLAAYQERIITRGRSLNGQNPKLKLQQATVKLTETQQRAQRATATLFNSFRQQMAGRSALLTRQNPTAKIIQARHRLTDTGARQQRAVQYYMSGLFAKIDTHGKILQVLSYKSVLARGFTVVRDARGNPLARAANIKPGQSLRIEFADSTIDAVSRKPTGQGELF